MSKRPSLLKITDLIVKKTFTKRSSWDQVNKTHCPALLIKNKTRVGRLERDTNALAYCTEALITTVKKHFCRSRRNFGQTTFSFPKSSDQF
jgi:hypothetical protein